MQGVNTMMLLRKFVTLDGEVLEETQWNVKPIDKCFYCGQQLMEITDNVCPDSIDYNHDWITLCNPKLGVEASSL